MGQRDRSAPVSYCQAVQANLDHPLMLRIPEAVLEVAAARTFAAGLEPREAAIRLCHEHAKLQARELVEQDLKATDLAEFTLACRIDESIGLARDLDQNILDILPDLPAFVGWPCFSEEFRDVIERLATWHRIPVHRWSAPGCLASPPSPLLD